MRAGAKGFAQKGHAHLIQDQENERVGYSRDEVFKKNCERVGKFPGGGGDSHIKQTGMHVGNFEFNP